MAILKIRPWPFNFDEEVELYWLCSPTFNSNREWVLKCVFKKDNKIKEVEIPWGTLPYLRLGQKYENGIITESSKVGDFGQVKINKANFNICTSFDMPPKLYYLYKNFGYGKEKLCKFWINGVTYYVPCIELARSFFAKSKTLTNYLLKPNGLELLINESKIVDKCLYLDLSIEIPENIVNKETAAHLGWIKYNKEAFESWISVYANLFVKKDSHSQIIELLPPVRSNCIWSYRGISLENSVLILEIISSTGLITPFENLKYTHPKIERNRVTEISGKYKTSFIEKDSNYELLNDQSGSGTRMRQHQPIIELHPMKFIFENIKKIEKVTKSDREVFLGTKIIHKSSTLNKGEENELNLVSTDDWSGGGKIEPIEFKSLELVKGKTGKGLEEFYKAIDILSHIYKLARISIAEVFLPKGKSFSNYRDGDRRTCAIIEIEKQNKMKSYIIEVGRTDNWSISTLIINQFSENLPIKVIEDLILKLLLKLLENNGHWEKQLFYEENRIRFEMMRHMIDDNYKRFAYRIIDKINQ